VVTSNFLMNYLYFSTILQSESRFAYLGDDKVGSLNTYVVAFAQRPEVATVMTNGHPPINLRAGHNRKQKTAFHKGEHRLRKTTQYFELTVPAAVETPASLGAAAHTLAIDHGLARESAHSNGWHDRCARAAHYHSPARAAVAVPGYR
jgi:hypothetical protein